MFCSKCGNKCLDNAAFCSSCGEKLLTPRQSNSLSALQELTREEKEFSYISSLEKKTSKAASRLTLLPPPAIISFRDKKDYKDDAVLSSAASSSGYYYYNREARGGASEKMDKTTRIVTVISMIFVFLIVGGPSVRGYLMFFTAFRTPHGEITNENYNYGLVLPDDWKTMKNPRKMLKARNAAGYFTKGNPMNPRIQMLIYYGGKNVAPENISNDLLDYLEPEIKRNNEYYAGMMGMKYELLSLSVMRINNRDALWIEGNTWCAGCEVKRDFTFYAFGENSSYYIKFVFKENSVEEYWPEIKSILESIVFYQ